VKLKQPLLLKVRQLIPRRQLPLQPPQLAKPPINPKRKRILALVQEQALAFPSLKVKLWVVVLEESPSSLAKSLQQPRKLLLRKPLNK